MGRRPEVPEDRVFFAVSFTTSPEEAEILSEILSLPAWPSPWEVVPGVEDSAKFGENMEVATKGNDWARSGKIDLKVFTNGTNEKKSIRGRKALRRAKSDGALPLLDQASGGGEVVAPGQGGRGVP